jgi:hypothetical protein
MCTAAVRWDSPWEVLDKGPAQIRKEAHFEGRKKNKPSVVEDTEIGEAAPRWASLHAVFTPY